MIFAALILAAAVPPVALPDEVGFEVLVGGGLPSGFRIDVTDRIAIVEGDPYRAQRAVEVRQGRPCLYAKAVAQLARYRPLADPSCVPPTGDIIAIRLSWREKGALHTALFADSCKGIPVDLVETMRPIAAAIEIEREKFVIERAAPQQPAER